MSVMYEKGQVFSLDAVMSIVIFMFLILILISSWYFYILRLDDNVKDDDLQFKTFQVSELLMKKIGYPSNWDNTNVQILGLVSNPRIISATKLQEFVEMSESDIKERLNIENFNFYFSLKDYNGAMFVVGSDFSEVGTKPGIGAENVFTLRRIGIYGGEEVVLEFVLWK